MLRVGLIIPSSNTTMEREFCTALQGIATVHSGRIKLVNVESRELTFLEKGVYEEAEKLATAEVDVIVYGCTSGSFIRGHQQYAAIEEEVEKSFGIPCVATAGAVIRALNHLKSRKIALITPYTRDITEIERNYLSAHGFETISTYHASIKENTSIGRVKDEEVFDWAVKHSGKNAEAVFISCTNLSTFKVLGKIEQTLNIPTVSSNSATLWNVLQRLGLKLHDKSLGQLFAK
jgi:maleate isomerase